MFGFLCEFLDFVSDAVYVDLKYDDVFVLWLIVVCGWVVVCLRWEVVLSVLGVVTFSVSV